MAGKTQKKHCGKGGIGGIPMKYSRKNKSHKFLLGEKTKKERLSNFLAIHTHNKILFDKLLKESLAAKRRRRPNPIKGIFLPKIKIIDASMDKVRSEMTDEDQIKHKTKTLFNAFVVDSYVYDDIDGRPKLSLLIMTTSTMSPILEETENDLQSPHTKKSKSKSASKSTSKSKSSHYSV